LWALPIRAGAMSGDPILLKADFRGTPVTLTRAGALFFESYGQKVDDLLIASLSIEAGAAKQIPQAASHDQVALSRRPRWSRDGQWFMYETRRPGRPVISMRMLKTGVVTEVPLELPYVWTFDLSPDGRKLVCRANDPEGHTGIFMVDTSTGEVEPVVLWQQNVTRQFVPQFSSDGRSVTYIVGDYHGNNKYVERSLETGVERVIATPPAGNGNYLRASPDGRFLLTYVETPSPAQVALRVYDLTTRQTREVFRVERGAAFTTEDGVQWMPDNRAIVANVRGAGENARELWWIPVDGGQPRRLDLGVNNVIDSGIAIDRDGTHIAFVAGDPLPSRATTLHYEFRLLEHFLPQPARR
jgi:Tol biopolymer transport system component